MFAFEGACQSPRLRGQLQYPLGFHIKHRKVFSRQSQSSPRKFISRGLKGPAQTLRVIKVDEYAVWRSERAAPREAREGSRRRASLLPAQSSISRGARGKRNESSHKASVNDSCGQLRPIVCGIETWTPRVLRRQRPSPANFAWNTTLSRPKEAKRR